jgi:hypothetical protein
MNGEEILKSTNPEMLARRSSRPPTAEEKLLRSIALSKEKKTAFNNCLKEILDTQNTFIKRINIFSSLLSNKDFLNQYFTCCTEIEKNKLQDTIQELKKAAEEFNTLLTQQESYQQNSSHLISLEQLKLVFSSVTFTKMMNSVATLQAWFEQNKQNIDKTFKTNPAKEFNFKRDFKNSGWEIDSLERVFFVGHKLMTDFNNLLHSCSKYATETASIQDQTLINTILDYVQKLMGNILNVEKSNISKEEKEEQQIDEQYKKIIKLTNSPQALVAGLINIIKQNQHILSMGYLGGWAKENDYNDMACLCLKLFYLLPLRL